MAVFALHFQRRSSLGAQCTGSSQVLAAAILQTKADAASRLRRATYKRLRAFWTSAFDLLILLFSASGLPRCALCT